MRIALFTDTYLPQVNGVSRTLARLVRSAERRGHTVALVTPRFTEETDSPAKLHLGLPGLPVPFYPELRLCLPLPGAVRRGLDSFAPDLVHVATEFTVGMAGVQWAAEAEAPLVTSFHTDFPAYLSGYGFAGLENLAWQYLRRFHRKARRTFCPSRATLEQLRGQDFHPRLSVWTRGVDGDRFHPSLRSEEVRRRIAPDADRILVYVGRLAPEKRLDLLLEAFGRIRAAEREAGRRRTGLVIVGDGPDSERLREEAGPGVHFTGYLSGRELAEAYAAGDVFAFPSDTETFGNVVLEAMASGVPVVAPARGGVLDTVVPGETGLLCPPGDPAAFAETCRELLEDGERRRRLAEGSRSAAESRSWKAIFDRLFEEYGQVAASGREALVA